MEEFCFGVTTMNLLSADDLSRMIEHWLSVPAGAYLGSNYGHNLHDFLQSPMQVNDGDAVASKLVSDIPILASLDAGSVSVFQDSSGISSRRILITVAGMEFEVPDADSF
jgi:hypothetical protein